jgi:hypothetical protein
MGADPGSFQVAAGFRRIRTNYAIPDPESAPIRKSRAPTPTRIRTSEEMTGFENLSLFAGATKSSALARSIHVPRVQLSQCQVSVPSWRRDPMSIAQETQ